MLHFTEETLNLIAVFIERIEKPTRLFPIDLVRNVWADPSFVQGVDKIVSIISFIGEHDGVRRNSFNQFIDNR